MLLRTHDLTVLFAAVAGSHASEAAPFGGLAAVGEVVEVVHVVNGRIYNKKVSVK